MQDYRKLGVWQKGHELALLTYKLTADFPREEMFGLRNSLRRSAVDLPAFIAEGCGKSDDGELRRAIGGAISLSNRLEYYALLAQDLEMLKLADHDLLVEKTVEVRKMLSGFAKRLSNESLPKTDSPDLVRTVVGDQ